MPRAALGLGRRSTSGGAGVDAGVRPSAAGDALCATSRRAGALPYLVLLELCLN
jgi:hypothetical protein